MNQTTTDAEKPARFDGQLSHYECALEQVGKLVCPVCAGTGLRHERWNCTSCNGTGVENGTTIKLELTPKIGV